MATTNHSGQEGVDERTYRACVGHMIVVPHGGGSGMFDVYSAPDGENNTYTVDLQDGRCTCPDAEYNLAPGEACKHERRCRLALGIDEVPVGVDVDRCLENSRAKFGAADDPDGPTPESESEPEPEPEPTATVTVEAKPERTVATDGGQVVADDSDACAFGNDRCDGPDGDGLPCFDCYLSTHLDHYPADAVAVPEVSASDPDPDVVGSEEGA